MVSNGGVMGSTDGKALPGTGQDTGSTPVASTFTQIAYAHSRRWNDLMVEHKKRALKGYVTREEIAGYDVMFPIGKYIRCRINGSGCNQPQHTREPRA